MARGTGLATLLLLGVSAIVAEVLTDNVVEEVVNAEHWDDLINIADGTGTPRVDAVLTFYAQSCKEKMHSLNIKAGNRVGPSIYFVVQGVHDNDARKKQHWYEWSEDYNLLARFEQNYTIACPTTFFLPADKSPPIVWDQQGTYSDFIYNNLRFDVTFENGYHSTVKVQWRRGFEETREVAILGKGESRTLQTFVSHTFISYDARTGKAFDYYVGERNHAHHVITDGHERDEPDKYWKSTVDRLVQDERLTHQMMWSHTSRLLNNMKRPPMTPAFTKLGYELRRMPEDLFQKLSKWYRANKRYGKWESWPTGGTQVNFDVVKTKMVNLPWKIKDEIADTMRPILEEWANVDLQFNTLYGIREYFEGSILKDHVDRYTTHVISAILQIDQDVDEDWELEVIDFNGKKVKTPMKPGDMMLYESAKLIHGRPKPVVGHFYASCFIHFTPIHGWDQFNGHGMDFSVKGEYVRMLPIEQMGTPWVGPYTHLRSQPTKTEL